MKRRSLALVAVLACLGGITAAVQPQTPATTDLAQLVPAPLRNDALRFLDTSLPEDARLTYLENIVEAGPATSLFLVRALAREPSVEARKMLIGAVDFRATAEAAAAVANRAQTDPSPEVREIAQAKLQWEQTAALKRGTRGLRELAAASRAAGAAADALETEAARREALARAASLLPPPPPVFSATEASPVRVVVLGDFGTRDHGSNDAQEQVAAKIAAFHKIEPFTIGVLVGDNFYSKGLDDTKDKRWERDWETPHGTLGVPFFVVPGNHDWLGTVKAIQTEIEYTNLSPSKTWRMPAAHYTFTAGPIQFFALDTDKMHEGEKDDVLEWLQTETGASKAPWRIAFGHHPFLTGGEGHGAAQSGGEDEEVRTLREKVLFPVLKKTVDVYLAGHDHELQLLDVEGVLEVVSGSGGRESDKVVKLPESLFCAKAFGFAVLEATATQLTIRFARLADKPGTFAYSCNVTRGADGKITQACSKRCPI